MKNRIIICGYPKSGNTWLTRLTAEVVGCPVAGYWCEPFNQDECIEGTDRESEFECYKAHHSIEQLDHTLALYGNGTEKVIYVVRDPRDVVISASYYFRLRPRYVKLYQLMSLHPIGRRLYSRLFHTKKHQIDRLTKGLLRGTKDGFWLTVPWEEHVRGYLESDVMIVKYSDLKRDTLSEVKRICEHLGIERSEEDLKQAIHNQSFENKKKALLASNELKKASSLRKGKNGDWKEALGHKNVAAIEHKIGGFIKELGYE